MKSESELQKVLLGVKKGTITVEDAVEQIKKSGFADLGFVRIDHGRQSRCGFPEVVFAEGKESEQVAVIAEKIVANDGPLLITRLDESKFRYLKKKLPKLVYNKQARTGSLFKGIAKKRAGIMIVTAGTSDIPVAEEAAVTCEALGFAPDRLYDAGVAGIHRLLAQSDKLGKAKVIIVAAGMEGALPSVIG